jgi:hypothetical protein
MRLRLVIRRPIDSRWFYWFAITGDLRCQMIGRKDELYPAAGILSPQEALEKAQRIPWHRVMPAPELVAELEGMIA